MRDVRPEMDRWLAAEGRLARAMVTSVWGSAPRPPGGKMVVAPSGALAGSVSGGCVEGAVVEAAHEVLAGGPPRLLEFGVADEDAWAVGLSCGGRIEVFVEAIAAEDEIDRQLSAALAEDRLVAEATVLSGPGVGRKLVLDGAGPLAGGLDDGPAEAEAGVLARRAFATFDSQRGACGDRLLFVDVHPPRPELILVGAVHVAVHLVAFAKALGFRTVVIDPRSAFATAERFGHADELVVAPPGRALVDRRLGPGTYLAVLSHDPKIDLPALAVALRGELRYLGALGSRKTHRKRLAALAEKGFGSEETATIRAPIGLDLGGRRPEEIAVAILAEMVAASHGRLTPSR
ncbi:MAG: XdhC/CoxI family protein [Acidobacteriota bacterium]